MNPVTLFVSWNFCTKSQVWGGISLVTSLLLNPVKPEETLLLTKAGWPTGRTQSLVSQSLFFPSCLLYHHFWSHFVICHSQKVLRVLFLSFILIIWVLSIETQTCHLLLMWTTRTTFKNPTEGSYQLSWQTYHKLALEEGYFVWQILFNSIVFKKSLPHQHCPIWIRNAYELIISCKHFLKVKMNRWA